MVQLMLVQVYEGWAKCSRRGRANEQEKKVSFYNLVALQVPIEPNVTVTTVEVPYNRTWEITIGYKMLKSS